MFSVRASENCIDRYKTIDISRKIENYILAGRFFCWNGN